MKKAGTIAGELSVHPDTIRNWTDRFPEFFSDEAQGKVGLRRTYTPKDEDVLYSIKTWVSQGFEFETIRAKLSSGELLQLIPSNTQPLEGETALAVYTQLRQLEAQLEARDQEIERLLAEREADRERLEKLIREATEWKIRYEILKEQIDKK